MLPKITAIFIKNIISKNYGSSLKRIELVIFRSTIEEINTSGVIQGIEAAGYHPAKIEELLVFATKHPDIQRHGKPIYGFGSVWKRAESEQVVPVLRGGDEDRNMHLLRINNNWNQCDLFAATRGLE